MTFSKYLTIPALFALTACSNNQAVPSTYYYVLDNTPMQQASASQYDTKSAVNQVKVKPVVLPDYLNQPNLVLKLSEHQITIANYHFWAEDLRQSVQQVLINELNQNHPDTSYSQMCADCDELVVTIDHFYPTEAGKVVLSGNYYLSSNYVQTRFSLQEDLNQGGYDEAVAAMRALLGELASQIK